MSIFRRLAHLEEQLGSERLEALLDSSNTGKIKVFCDELLRRKISESGLVKKRLVIPPTKVSSRPPHNACFSKMEKKGSNFKEVANIFASARSENSFSLIARYESIKGRNLKELFDEVESDAAMAEFTPIGVCRLIRRMIREIECEYVFPRRDMTTDEVISEMANDGLRPAISDELIDFSKKYPNEQKKFRIVALGSVCKWVLGQSGVACLSMDHDGKRRFEVMISELGGWDRTCRFLAVRE